MVSATLKSVTIALCAMVPLALGQDQPGQPGQGEQGQVEPGQDQPGQEAPEQGGQPEPEVQEFTVKWSNTNDCTDDGGEEQIYPAGECVGVPEDTLAVDILDRPEGCVAISFSDGDCNEEQETLEEPGCSALQERYSVLFQC